jgi:hypothetical protein
MNDLENKRRSDGPVRRRRSGEGGSNPVKVRQTSSKGSKRMGNPAFLCSAIPENRAFFAKFSEPSFRMTNEKFSMTNFQFRLSALVAACRAVSWRLRAFAFLLIRGQKTRLNRPASQSVAVSRSDFFMQKSNLLKPGFSALSL